MRILICGSRNFTDRDAIVRALEVQPIWPVGPETIIVHGAARGADTLAGEVAKQFGFHVEAHPADWKQHGKAAGPIRNQEMLDSGVDVVLAFPLGESRGTWDMVRRARAAGVPVCVFE